MESFWRSIKLSCSPLKRFYFNRQAPPTDIYTNPKERKEQMDKQTERGESKTSFTFGGGGNEPIEAEEEQEPKGKFIIT